MRNTNTSPDVTNNLKLWSTTIFFHPTSKLLDEIILFTMIQIL
ncbi:hypothetical protein V6Z12_D05G063600 [Gossypium hirsutum]